MDIERDADDDLDFERLPSGAVVTGRDAKYLRNLRERATLNRPDELESDPVAAEPSIERLLDDLNDLHEQRAELIDLLQESETRNRDLQIQIANLFGEEKKKHRLYSREVQKLLDAVHFSNEDALRATTSYLTASDGRWARLKVAAALSGLPLQTIRDWTDAGAIRWGRSAQAKGIVLVYLPDVFTQKVLRGR